MGGTGFWWTWRVLGSLLLVPGILGWGKEGHYTICKIAEGFLSEEALAAVKELLPASAKGDLAEVCSWPDEIRYSYHWRWSSPLHYVDTPDFKCNYKYCRDCHDSVGHKDRCVTAAIYNYLMQLSSGYHESISESGYNLTEALMFLSHFIGDVHQPLHVGFTGDEGGNKIMVWDNMIIESAVKTYYSKDLAIMIKAIERNITDGWFNVIPSWKICANNQTVCPNEHAFESISLACKYAYRNATPGSTLTELSQHIAMFNRAARTLTEAWKTKLSCDTRAERGIVFPFVLLWRPMPVPGHEPRERPCSSNSRTATLAAARHQRHPSTWSESHDPSPHTHSIRYVNVQMACLLYENWKLNDPFFCNLFS